ncbi:MAG: hypothetical protein DRG78_22305 [Epsilonproteobacteria bacterium]|nr:MAG: hypothetical protein DRG78_22305 [Campylobacterota bacterium]
MHKITLEINNSIYEHIMFFLENLPKNLVNIKQEIGAKTKKTTKQSSILKMRNLQGVGKELYQDIDSDTYIKELRNEW